MAGFDVNGARRAGYSDADIADHLAGQRNFDIAAAREAGYTDRDLLAYLVRPPERGVGDRAARAVGMVGAGANESIATTLGAVPDLVSRGMRAVGIPTPEPGFYTDKVRQGLRAITGEPPTPETTTERALYGGARGTMDAAAMMAPGLALSRLAPAGSVAQGVGQALTAQPVMQGVAGAAGGAANDVVTDATGSPGLGMVAGIGAAAAVPAARFAVSRAMQPVQTQLTPEAQRLLGVMDAEGIPTTAGQRSGSTALQGLEATFERLPLTSGPQNAQGAAQRAEYTRAALQRAGIDASVASPQVLASAERRIGGEIGAIAGRTTGQVTPEIRQTLDGFKVELQQFADQDIGRRVLNRVAQVESRISDGTINGRTLRELDSAIAAQLRASKDGDLRGYLSDLRSILHDMIEAGAKPGDAEALRQARRHYANLVVIENAAGGAGAATARGELSPAQLRMALQQSVGRRGYATGRGDLNELVRAGEQFVRPQIPNSGTPERTFWTNMLTGAMLGGGGGAAVGFPGLGAAAGAAGAVAPRMAQAVYNTGPVQNYLAGGVPAWMGRVYPVQPNALAGIAGTQARAALENR